MTILQALGARDFIPFCRAHAEIQRELHARLFTFVLGRLIAFNSGDVRWAILAVALRLLGVAMAVGERQLARWALNVLRRAWQGARFAADRRAADSMVAAGGR